MVLLKVAKVIYFFSTLLLDPPEDYNFFNIKARVKRVYLTIAHFWVKKTVSPVVVSESKYTVKGTSSKYLKLLWKEIIFPLLKQ